MNYKTMTKILGAGAKGAMGASILSEIGSIGHGSKWNFDYFDHKFNLISTNMGLMEDEVKNMANYIEKHLEKEVENIHGNVQSGKTTVIITATVSFILIVILMLVAVYLSIKTKSSHFQKRMEGLLKVVGNLKTEYKSKVHLLSARRELDTIEEREQRMAQRMRQIQKRTSEATYSDSEEK